jgi:glutamate synthase domain-containing protein 3
VRNSGATAIVEGVGDHGCEYMTRGLVVVLGKTGRNFAAGMSGGVAYVFDEEGNFASRCNMGMVELGPVSAASELSHLHALIVRHHQYTQSAVARRMLDRWDEQVGKFVKVLLTEYRMVLERQHLGANNDMAKLAAV